MRSQHIWTEKDDEGCKREVRVTKFGGVWRFQSKSADEDRWTYYDRPLLEDLRDIARNYFPEISAAPRIGGRPGFGRKITEREFARMNGSRT